MSAPNQTPCSAQTRGEMRLLPGGSHPTPNQTPCSAQTRGACRRIVVTEVGIQHNTEQPDAGVEAVPVDP